MLARNFFFEKKRDRQFLVSIHSFGIKLCCDLRTVLDLTTCGISNIWMRFRFHRAITNCRCYPAIETSVLGAKQAEVMRCTASDSLGALRTINVVVKKAVSSLFWL